jgi:hypothetical protein
LAYVVRPAFFEQADIERFGEMLSLVRFFEHHLLFASGRSSYTLSNFTSVYTNFVWYPIGLPAELLRDNLPRLERLGRASNS